MDAVTLAGLGGLAALWGIVRFVPFGGLWDRLRGSRSAAGHRKGIYDAWDVLWSESDDKTRKALLPLLPDILASCERNHGGDQ